MVHNKKMYVYALVMISLIIGEIMIVVLIHNSIEDNQEKNIRNAAKKEADTLLALSNTAYYDLDYILKRNVGLFQVNGIYMSLSDYNIYLGTNILPESLSVQYQRWIPRILHQDREFYEEYGKANISPNFEITTFIGDSLTNLSWIRTPNNTEYYSLMLSIPALPNSIPSGGDFLTSRNSDIFLEVLDFNGPYLTRRIGLFMFLNQENYGIEYYSPVYIDGNISSVNIGFVQLLFIPSIIMKNLLEFSDNSKNIEYMIFNLDSAIDESIIYVDSEKYPNIRDYSDILKIESKYIEIRDFPFVNRNFRFVFIFTDDFAKEFDDFFPESVIIFLTLLFTLLNMILAVIVWTIYRNYVLKKQESFNMLSVHTSHELRNPTNVIKNFVEFATDDLLEYKKNHLDQDLELIDQTLDKLRIVSKRISSIEIILGDSLIVHQLHRNTVKITYSSFQLKDLIDDLKIAVIPKLQECPMVELVTDIDDPETNLYTDYQHLQQILINLIVNAIKFSDNGNVKLKTSRKNKGLLFEVIDNGCGIPLNKQKNIFVVPFYQLKTKPHQGGVGMGLYISKKLSEILDYELSFTSYQKNDQTWETNFNLLVHQVPLVSLESVALELEESNSGGVSVESVV